MSIINYLQHCATTFCVKFGHNATETFTKLTKVYGTEMKLCQDLRFLDSLKQL